MILRLGNKKIYIQREERKRENDLAFDTESVIWNCLIIRDVNLVYAIAG